MIPLVRSDVGRYEVVLQQQLTAASKWTTGNMSLDQGLTHAAGFPGEVEVFFDNVVLDVH